MGDAAGKTEEVTFNTYSKSAGYQRDNQWKNNIPTSTITSWFGGSQEIGQIDQEDSQEDLTPTDLDFNRLDTSTWRKYCELNEDCDAKQEGSKRVDDDIGYDQHEQEES